MKLETVLATVELYSAFICVFAFLYRLFIKKARDRRNNILNISLVFISVLLASDFLIWFLSGMPGIAVYHLMNAVSMTFYTVDYVLILLLLHYVTSFCKERKFEFALLRICEILLLAETFLAVLSLKTGWLFMITPNHYLGRGPLFYVSQGIALLMFMTVIMAILGNAKILKGRLLYFCMLLTFPLIASLIQATGIVKLNLSVEDFGIIVSVMMMLTMQLDMERKHRERQQRMIENQMDMIRNQQKEIADLRVSAVLSQIQPHFIFNVLNIIYYLCETDPMKAQHAVDLFSDYLRTNIDSLQTNELVPFSQELKHVKNYISLEMLRFEDDLTVKYDIEAEEFYLPVLSVQPLVENAIKHGISKSENPGLVTIRSTEDEENYYIYVVDNGVGFDPNEEKHDGRQHIGIENVRSRLDSRCDASLDIFTQMGVGTTSVITIPKKKREE